MNLRKNDIHFTVIYEEQPYAISTYRNEYRHLMSLIRDKICPDDFGECGGMGRCGTCLIELTDHMSQSEISYRNEDSTLRKMGIVNPRIRLSCQILISDELHNAYLKIIDSI